MVELQLVEQTGNKPLTGRQVVVAFPVASNEQFPHEDMIFINPITTSNKPTDSYSRNIDWKESY
jgi:hypothetical protein